MYLLVVMGDKSARAWDVAGILAGHREHGRYWTSKRYRLPRRGARVVAKVAGVSELWMTGVFESGEPERDPNPYAPDRWRLAYPVAWDEPAATGVPVRDVLGPKGVHAHQMIRLTEEEYRAAEQALYGGRGQR
jgi:hypothetical protein